MEPEKITLNETGDNNPKPEPSATNPTPEHDEAEVDAQLEALKAPEVKENEIPTAKMKVLAVDDDNMNLEVLNHIIKKRGYEVANALDGEDALVYMEQHPGEVDIVLLDKMMPKLNGIETLKRMKQNPALKDIPVIMQTAAVSQTDVIEGIECGVYYYLTKPFDDDMLISIVDAAAREYNQRRHLREIMEQSQQAFSMVKNSEFEFSTIEESRNLAAVIANFFPDPGRVVIGLLELMINAVEHGNLGVGYQTKAELVETGKWEEEIERRLALPENQGKKVHVNIKRDDKEVVVTIKDQGEGFDPSEYVDFDPIRMTDPNGRGIAKANVMAFDTMEFTPPGNEVICKVSLEEEQEPEPISGDNE